MYKFSPGDRWIHLSQWWMFSKPSFTEQKFIDMYKTFHFSELESIQILNSNWCRDADARLSKYVDFSQADELLHYDKKTKKTNLRWGMLIIKIMYNIKIKEKIPAAFSYVEIVIRLFLCLVVTNCSSEDLFSRLKMIF